MIKSVIWALLAAVLLQAVVCSAVSAKERKFSPVPGDGQEVRFADGNVVLATGNKLANLAVMYVPIDKKSAVLVVWAENASDMQFNFAETSLTASADGKPLHVLTYDDLVKEEKRKEFWAGFWTALAAGVNSYNASQAGYSHTSGSYYGSSSGSVYGSRGGYASYSGSLYGSYYSTSYSAGAAYWAQADAAARNQAMFDRFQSTVNEARRTLKMVALKANTLMPGQSVLGRVKFDLPSEGHKAPAEFTMRVDLAGMPLTLLFREGPPVIDTTPHAVVNNHPVGPMSNDNQSGSPRYGVSSPIPQGTIGHGDSEYTPAPLNHVDYSPSSATSSQDISFTPTNHGNSSTTITGRFTGKAVELPGNGSGSRRFNCEYDTGHGKTVWHTSFGSCPGTWEGQ